MAQPADVRDCDHASPFLGFDRLLYRGVLVEPKGGSIRAVIVNVRPDHTSKLSLIDRDHMIQAVSS